MDRSIDFSWISCAFVLLFRSCDCTACVYRSFECTFGPTIARSVFLMHSKKGFLKRATLLLLFATTRSSVSVLVHIPHASFVLLKALSGPLSSTVCVCRFFSARYRSLNYVSKRVFCVARGFLRPIVPKNNFPTNLAKAHEYGRICPNCQLFFWRLLAKNFWFFSWSRSGSVRGSIPPWASVAR
jgi:hypothetical protein